MRDIFGEPISIGDTIAWPSRQSGNMWLIELLKLVNVGIVYNVNRNRVFAHCREDTWNPQRLRWEKTLVTRNTAILDRLIVVGKSSDLE